jgi:hypothetical protein
MSPPITSECDSEGHGGTAVTDDFAGWVKKVIKIFGITDSFWGLEHTMNKEV